MKKYIIGVDMGHGETAVTCYDVESKIQKHLKLVREDSWTYSIYSAFYIGSDGNARLIGKNEASERAALDPSFRQGFKKKVSEMSENDKESMRIFVKALYNAIINNPTVKLTAEDDISFCVACPTEWSLEDAYEYMDLIYDAGMPLDWIVSEAWAAYSKFQKSNLAGSKILVIDYGSSTIDYCAVDLTREGKIILMSSAPLGAHGVEKSVINDARAGVLTHITKIRRDCGTDVNMDLLYFASRLAKEEFFRNRNEKDYPYLLSVTKKHFSSPPLNMRDKVFKWYADESEQAPHLNDIERYKDYTKEFKDFIASLQKGLSQKHHYTPDVIVLSGSASQMDFVKKTIQGTFGENVSIYLDENPEYVVCDGIVEIAKDGDLRETFEYYPYGRLVEQYKAAPEGYLLKLQNNPFPPIHEKHALGLCYLLGIGCKKSPNKAYLQFSDDSDFSILMRAWMYITGTGVACNLDKAREQLELIDSGHDGRKVLDEILKNNKPQEGLYETTYILNFCKDSLETGIGYLVSALINETNQL